MTRALIALLALAGCGDDGEPIADGPAGSATYYVENQTEEDIDVEWVTSPQLGERTESAGPISPGSRAELLTDGSFGINPRPPDSFSQLRLLIAGVLVYVQDPVATAEWTVVQQSENDYHHADITLSIGTDDLAPDYGLPEGECCCAHVIEGDILTEDALPVADCAARDSGQCVIVDPGRLTPHPCCPSATGERCGP